MYDREALNYIKQTPNSIIQLNCGFAKTDPKLARGNILLPWLKRRSQRIFKTTRELLRAHVFHNNRLIRYLEIYTVTLKIYNTNLFIIFSIYLIKKNLLKKRYEDM